MLLEQHRKIARDLEEILRRIKELPPVVRNDLIDEVKVKLDSIKTS